MPAKKPIVAACLAAALLAFPVLGDGTFAAQRLAAMLPVISTGFGYAATTPIAVESNPGATQLQGATQPQSDGQVQTDYEAWAIAQHRAAVGGGLLTRSLPLEACPLPPTAARTP